MDRKELQVRRRFRQNYQMNKKYFDTGDYKDLEECHLKNIRILEEYEKNEKQRL